MLIQSVHNPKAKAWRELLTRKGRDKQGCFLVEGLRSVEEALRSGAVLRAVLHAERQELPEEWLQASPGFEAVTVSDAVLAACSDTQTPQGVIAVAEITAARPEHVMEAPDSLAVVVDGLQDPGNLGTIIRAADAAGAQGVIVGHGSVDPYNPKTVRSTMGSLFHLPVIQADLTELLPAARARGIRIADARLDATQSCYEADLTEAVWFVIGNEAGGVSDEVSRLSDVHLRIPMPGRAESLNAAMAATVLLFEAVRQRQLK